MSKMLTFDFESDGEKFSCDGTLPHASLSANSVGRTSVRAIISCRGANVRSSTRAQKRSW